MAYHSDGVVLLQSREDACIRVLAFSPPGKGSLILLCSLRLSVAATLAAIALSALAPNANAQTFYNNLSAFNAAATTGTLYTFEGISPDSSFVENPAVLVTPAPGRITFVVTGGPDTRVLAIDSAFLGGIYQVSDGTDSVGAGVSADTLATTRINLDASYTAFAIEIGQNSNVTNAYTIGLYDNDTQVGTNFSSGTTNDIFFGATSDIAFNNVRVFIRQGTISRTVFDNARTGSAVTAVTAAPEPGSIALALVGGIGMMGAVVRRRKA
jgi:hypothetical protein